MPLTQKLANFPAESLKPGVDRSSLCSDSSSEEADCATSHCKRGHLCYNSGSYIIDAVESARKQSGDFILNEIIVIDDHSGDVATLKAFLRNCSV